MAGVVALLGAATLTGCGADPVEVPASRGSGEVPAAQRAACERLVDALPEQVGGLERDEVTGNPLGAAWGDPAVVLRCGVGSPEGFTPLSTCQEINGVVWFVPDEQVVDQGRDVLATSMGVLPRVDVAIPAELRPPQGILTDLSDALRDQRGVPDPDEPCRP